MMKLLAERANDQDVECLVENTSQGKKYFLEGKWASANERNRNGRVYPGAVMEGAIGKYHTEYISVKRALGELNHPPTPTVNLDRVSHNIESLKIEGNNVIGKAKVLSTTPMGQIVCNLIDEGIKLGVSTRGLGSVKQVGGINEVQSDFFIAAIDIVSDPSGKDCWVNGILEGKNWALNADGNLVEVATELIVDLNKKKINEEVLLREMKKFMKRLTNK